MINGLDLFSGIGGISEALAPWVRTAAYCENHDPAQGILFSRMFRGEIDLAPIWDDIKTLEGGGAFPTSTSSQAAGHARETALQELERAWQTSEVVLSQKSLGLFATFDPAMSSWKTCQGSLLLQGTGLDSSSINWPNAGMTQGGQCFQLRKLVPPTDGTASGSSQRRMVSARPTPTASDGRRPIPEGQGKHGQNRQP